MHGGDIIEGVVLRAELIGETVSVRTAVSDESLTVRQLAYEWHVERDKKLLGPLNAALSRLHALRAIIIDEREGPAQVRTADFDNPKAKATEAATAATMPRPARETP